MVFSNIIESATVDTSNYTTALLVSNTQYYWRVTASNQCVVAASSTIFDFTTADVSCDPYTATDTPIAISASPPPNQSYISTITVAPNLSIVDVNVTINITHTWVSDLDITLTSPTGTIVDLSTGNGSSDDNYTNTVFDQEADDPITGGTAPFTGSFIPEGDLSTIYGELSAGDWLLTVTDTENGDGGSLDEFTLELCLQNTLSVDQKQFEGFTIYPNPNHGAFNVRLNSNSSENIKIDVYDLRGRRIFNNIYNGSVVFNEVVRLNNVQSGLYILKVSDGSRTGIKKIIVK